MPICYTNPFKALGELLTYTISFTNDKMHNVLKMLSARYSIVSATFGLSELFYVIETKAMNAMPALEKMVITHIPQ